MFLHNFVAHTFQRNVWYCVVWEPAQAVFFPTTDVTNLSRALLQGDKNFQLRSSFRENREGQRFENNLWFVSIPCDMWYLCDIWELFFFLRQSLIKVRVKKIKILKYWHFDDINMSSCVTLLGFPQEHCPWVSSGEFRLRLSYKVIRASGQCPAEKSIVDRSVLALT